MPSVVTGIIGGYQGASAAHNAAKAQQQGYQQAATSVNTAVANANPILSGAASAAGAGVSTAAANAGQMVGTAAGGAQTGIANAANNANALFDPYINNGVSASDRLNNLTSAGFSFNPSDLQNDPGYQFQLQQGMKALGNSTAARGLGTSGLALKGAAGFAEGLAGTSYQNAYNRALQGYQANVNSLLPGAQMGLAASGTAGGNLMNAAQYSGNVGINAAQYAGNTGMAGAEYSGNAGMWGAGQVASNLVNAGVYQGNTQIGAGNAIAQGDIGAANQWNSMLGSIGQAGNTILAGGFAPGGGGWSFGNLGTNFGNLFGAGNYGMPTGANWGGGTPGPGGVPYYNPNPGTQGPS